MSRSRRLHPDEGPIRGVVGMRFARSLWRPATAAGLFVVLCALSCAVAWAGKGQSAPAWVEFMDLFGSHSATAGLPMPAGSVVAVFDPRGVQCGVFTTTVAGAYGLLPCYGDMGGGGPVAGDRLYFKVNGVAATTQAVTHFTAAVAPDTVVTWASGDRWQVDLVVPPRPTVTVTLQAVALRLDWQAAGADVATYEVWRSSAPSFAPGDASAVRLGVLTSGGDAFTWPDSSGVGKVSENYTYRIRSLNVLSQTVGYSQAVADFDFALVP